MNPKLTLILIICAAGLQAVSAIPTTLSLETRIDSQDNVIRNQRFDLDKLTIEVADLRYQIEHIKREAANHAINWMKTPVEEVVEHFAEVYNTDAVKNLTTQEMEKVLKTDNLKLGEGHDEELVYEALLGWVKADEAARKSDFCDLLKDVRILRLGEEFIKSKIQTNPLISGQKECNALIKDVRAVIMGSKRRPDFNCDATMTTDKRGSN